MFGLKVSCTSCIATLLTRDNGPIFACKILLLWLQLCCAWFICMLLKNNLNHQSKATSFAQGNNSQNKKWKTSCNSIWCRMWHINYTLDFTLKDMQINIQTHRCVTLSWSQNCETICLTSNSGTIMWLHSRTEECGNLIEELSGISPDTL